MCFDRAVPIRELLPVISVFRFFTTILPDMLMQMKEVIQYHWYCLATKKKIVDAEKSAITCYLTIDVAIDRKEKDFWTFLFQKVKSWKHKGFEFQMLISSVNFIFIDYFFWNLKIHKNIGYLHKLVSSIYWFVNKTRWGPEKRLIHLFLLLPNMQICTCDCSLQKQQMQ